MGAFFLFRSDELIDEAGVRAVFERKGFQPPKEFQLGPLTLWLYRKQLVEQDNYYFADPQTAIFATGTIVYRGKSYRESLRSALEDFRKGSFSLDEALGSFCLMFWIGGRLSIATDRLNVHHVFIDERRTRLSNSFLAMLASFEKKLAVNESALYEKLLTGYIVGPDTLVVGIQQITDALLETASTEEFTFVPHPPRPHEVEFWSDGFDSCVDHQIGVLCEYFRRIGPLASEFPPELGLSSGYDSRLVLALAKELPVPLALHTHATQGVHDLDRSIVSQMAEYRGCELRVVPTRPMDQQSIEGLDKILRDGLYYYDGRCAHNMGAFSETYTRAYKVEVLGPRRLSLNGLGGEIYRNYYFTARSRFNCRQWMDYHVYYNPLSLPDRSLRDSLHEYVMDKISDALDSKLGSTLDQHTMRRYYSEVRMPDCDGINHNAHNQVAFYLTPFIEYHVVREAYRALPWIGISGRFQAAMIARVDPQLAAFPSHYGFPLSCQSWGHRFKAALKGGVPDRFWNWRRWFQMRVLGDGRPAAERYKDMKQRYPLLRECEEALLAYAPKMDLEMCARHYAQAPTCIFVGSFLREFAGRLR